MGNDRSDSSRRRFLRFAGGVSVLSLAGCLGDSGHHGQIPREMEDLDAPLAPEEENCTSIDGVERDPEELTEKGPAGYVTHSLGFQQCSNCKFYCPSTDLDMVGACARVAGGVRPQDWCGLYQPTDALVELPNAQPIPDRSLGDEGSGH